jgi:AcrR family transcriptional regulator
VFNATLTLLAEEGVPGLTFEAVAAAAGVNKTTLYRNWPTRTALILAAARTAPRRSSSPGGQATPNATCSRS